MCAAYRIPHSEFLAWSADDRDKAIWWHVRSQSHCPQCGTRPEEWDESQGGNRNAYLPVEHRCRGCEVRQAKEESLAGDDLGRGVKVVLVPNPKLEVKRGRNHGA